MNSGNMPVWIRRKMKRLLARGASIKGVHRSIAAYKRARQSGEPQPVVEMSTGLSFSPQDLLKAAGFRTA